MTPEQEQMRDNIAREIARQEAERLRSLIVDESVPLRAKPDPFQAMRDAFQRFGVSAAHFATMADALAQSFATFDEALPPRPWWRRALDWLGLP